MAPVMRGGRGEEARAGRWEFGSAAAVAAAVAAGRRYAEDFGGVGGAGGVRRNCPRDCGEAAADGGSETAGKLWILGCGRCCGCWQSVGIPTDPYGLPAKGAAAGSGGQRADSGRCGLFIYIPIYI